ncbi:MAG: non-canonical purine NTP pyrophosphatase [Patescibacteria group bacterium]|nr:non-canonical purine NTP pyrophosphatase [Patescibacteria group bacterium]
MKKKIFLATHNEGKIQRFKNLIVSTGLDIEIYAPKDFGLENIETEENGKNLAENAEIKARAYFGKIDMPILSNDTGFWVEGEGLVDAPKRKALGEKNEKTLTKNKIAKSLLEFWKEIAKKHGGKVNAAWIEEFALLDPDGTIHKSESKREVILTDQEFGKGHIQMPVRALYISKTTNKPSIQHSKEEELLELKPVTDALFKILTDSNKK